MYQENCSQVKKYPAIISLRKERGGTKRPKSLKKYGNLA